MDSRSVGPQSLFTKTSTLLLLTDCSEKGSDLEMERDEDDLFELMRASVATNWTVFLL